MLTQRDSFSPEKYTGVALYDMDGTLLPWDTQKLFCNFVLREENWRRIFLILYLPMLILFPLLGSEGLKRVFLSFLWRMPRHKVEHYGRGFAHHMTGKYYKKIIDRVRADQAEGRLLILASASPEFYVKEIGKQLGFHLSLGTQVHLENKQKIFPELVNHKGQQKVQRLQKILNAQWYKNGKIKNARGYTDSKADLPMLAICEQAVVINPSQQLETIANENGWEIIKIDRPWKNNWQRLWLRIRCISGCCKSYD